MKSPLWLRFLSVGALSLGTYAAIHRIPIHQALADNPKITTVLPATATGGETAPVGDYVPLAKGSVSFNKHIAPILFENCATCHRAGEVAPFALMSYADAKKRARQIAEVTQSGIMPPWKADEGKEKFLDAHRLTQAEIGLIAQWASEGAPEGRAADLPPAPKFTPGWQSGAPDLVLQADAPYHLEAEGDDVYRCFVVPTNFAEDRYVSMMEVRPGNRPVVHHLIAYLDTSGRAREKDAADAGPGYTSFGGIGVTPSGTLGGWAPGLVSRPAPQGTGILLPKGADVVLQVHYHKSGKPELDQTKIGLYFAKGPIDKRIRNLMIVNPRIRIPAGEANYQASAKTVVPTDITALNIMPHMHLLGKAMKITAALPDGAEKKLVNVTDWDFNWQMSYNFKDAIHLPAGTRLDMTARYDNSAENFNNPSSPPRPVTWGEQTTDEMCIAFLFYTVDSEHLTQGVAAPAVTRGLGERPAGGTGPDANGGMLRQLLKRFDANGDGKLDEDERAAALKWWREGGME